MVSQRKAEIIARATEALDPAEARAAEALVADRAGRLTPGGLRAAIRRAVMEVAPGKAARRREQAARAARVERWGEDSGNAALAGRELPPAAVLAANQRVTAWAKELKRAGLDGDMDQLRARAYLDILLGTDSRPRPDAAQGTPGTQAAGDGRAGAIGAGRAGQLVTGRRAAGRGGAARVRRQGQPDHPGHHRDPARRPARRAGRHRAHRPRPGPRPRVRGRPQPAHYLVRHRDRPGRARHRARLRPARTRHRPGTPPNGTNPARRAAMTRPAARDPGEPRFTFTPAGPHGPPGGYGTWRLSTGQPGQRDLIVAIGPIAIRSV